MSGPPPIGAAILTVSDRCWRGESEDKSGPALAKAVVEQLDAAVVAMALVPDERDQIAAQILAWARGTPRIDLLLTTGGTGLALRDVTPEATLAILDRQHPGLIQLMQMRCYAKTPRTFLSRGVAGTIGRTLVINLPGFSKGAVESIEALFDVLPHAIHILRGDVTDHSPQSGKTS